MTHISPETTLTDILHAPALPADALQQAQALLGMPIRVELWNHEATRDTIRHYAWGLGDDNPLYCDPAYARKTRYGDVIAPPTFLYGIFDAVVAPGLPDIQWFYAGTDWVFDRPIRRNEEISVKADYTAVRQVGGDNVARMLLQTGEVTYLDPSGKRVARALSHTFRVPRASAGGGLTYKPRAAQTYTRADLEAIQSAAVNEFRRGADTLCFEDVAVGDVLPGTVRGPLSQLDMTCYYAGAVGTSGYKSTKLKWLYNCWAHNAPERIPNNYDPSYFGAAISPSIGHQNAHIAVQEMGMPGPYDNGPQRIGMMATCVTNWMGDDGLLREFSVRLKLPVIFSDTLYTKGKVTGKRRDGAHGFVEADVWAENQLGQTTASGRALIQLPFRGS